MNDSASLPNDAGSGGSDAATGVRLSWAAMSELGGRASNQDRLGAARHGSLVCLVVADGAGGHRGGETAATLVVDAVLAAFCQAPAVSAAAALAFIAAAEASVQAAMAAATSAGVADASADATVDATADASAGATAAAIAIAAGAAVTADAAPAAVPGATADMRATVAVLLVDQASAEAVWAHLGDSRIYLLRGGAVHAVTRDHSLVQQLVDAGYVGSAALRTHPQRHVLLAAVGASSDGIGAVAAAAVRLQPGDALLLCTDGLWEWVDDAAMLAALPTSGRSQDWLDGLGAAAARSAAMAPAGAGARDNFSAYAIGVHGPQALP